LIGYYAALLQLHKLGISKHVKIDLDSDFYRKVHTMFEEMGDNISLQYGGSIAHHSNTGKQNKIFKAVPELVTSVKRHFANNFTDK